jgi:hypothetical protein
MDILKMSFFENRARDLKFLYIITSSASALPFSRGYLYALGIFYYLIRTESIMLRIHKIAENLQKMGRILVNLFSQKRVWQILGDVLNTRRGQNSIYVPKSGVLVFTLFRHFFAHFLGDLLYFIKSGFFCGRL